MSQVRRVLQQLGCVVLASLKHKGKVAAYVVEVPLDQIKYSDYQRGVSKSHVNKMEVNFQFTSCPPLSLSLRKNNLWCYDGQHRIDLLIAQGYTKFYAVVVFGLTYAQEAERFYLLNQGQRKMNGWTKYQAAYNAGDRTVKRAIRECDKRNLTQPITWHLSGLRKGDIASSSWLERAIAVGGWSLLTAMLDVFDQCWRSSAGPVVDDVKDTALVRGLILFLKEHYLGKTKLPWRTIKMVLKNVDPQEIRRLAKEKPTKRPDQRQYHQALCDLFGVNDMVRTPAKKAA